MLSIYTLKSATKASDYYQQENYYAKTTLSFQGHWFGKGAERLGLSGNGKLDQFKDLLLGKLSSEIMMEQTKKGKYHRPGYDLTFSAPKSVSILATLLDDESILLAHRTAVQQVLTIIEKEYAATRVKGEKGLTIEKTGNLIFSIFEHNDSRALDPEIHSHAILMNATQRENGEWRTLYSYSFYRDKILLGMYYRAFLAQELMKLGFEIIQTSHQGTFELKDFPPQLIKQFSKRREQIKEALAKSGHSGGKAAKVANFNTRPPKRQVEPEHLNLAWTVELNRCGYSVEWLQQYVDMAKKRGPVVPPNPQKLAEDALKNAITHLSEWQGVFTLKELKKSALGLSILSHSEAGLEKAVVKQLEKGDLLYVGDGNFTTQTARDLEIQNSAAMRLGKKQMSPIFGKLSAKYISGRLFERVHEKKVFECLLTHQDREIVLHYHRKSDFKAIMTPYIQLMKQYYLYPTLLTQSAVRAKALGQALGTDYSRTITGFLFSLEKRLKKIPHPKPLAEAQQGREVWVMDGESEIGLGQVRELQRYAQHFGARIIWGQVAFKKIPAIQSLIKQGIQEVSLIKPAQEKIFEQLTRENLKALLQELKQNNQLIEISDWKKREDSIVQKYLQLRDDTSVWVYSKTERQSLNQQIRIARQKEGVLSGPELIVQTLQPIKLTKVQKSLAKFYQLNDVIKITKENLALEIAANTYLTIKDIQLGAKTLTLIDETGKEISWQLNRKNAGILQLYRPEIRALQVNDWITWNETLRYPDNRAFDRLSGEKAKVVAIEEGEFKVELNNKTIVTLDKHNKKDTHWDYGYVVNHRQIEAEGTPMIVVLNSQAERLTEVFAKVLIGAGKEVTLFCDDTLKVEERLLQGNTHLLALDKPVTYYVPSVENKEEKYLQEYFPKYSARLQGYFSEHRQLLETVLKEYEKEKPILTLFDAKEAQINENSSSVPVVTNSSISTFALAQKVELKNHTESEMKEIKQAQIREACHAIDWICAKYGEREAVFDLKQLQEELFKSVGLTIPAQILEEQLQFALEKGILLPISKEVVSKQGVEETKTLAATREIVALEKACLYLVENSKNEMAPLMTKEAVAQSIQATEKLTQGQKSALELTLTTQDRVIGIQGVAGGGKTTLLKTLNRESRLAGYTVLGLSNSTAARQRLQVGSQDLSSFDAFLKSGIKSLTTRKFLMDCTKLLKQDEKLARLEYGGNKILVLDEASFTSTRELFTLVNVVKKLDIRLVMLGDYKQLNSVEAGRIFYLLLGSNMSSIAITENVRFDTLKALKTMQFIYKNQIGDALQNLGCSLVEIPDRFERLKYIANLYLEKTIDKEADVLVVTPLHKDRKWVNQLIHEGLKEKGCLKGVEVEATILVPINITEVEKQKIYSFTEDQWIRFNQPGLNIAIKAGEYCKILQKNYTDHTLLLERVNGEKLYWSPERHIRQDMGALEVYKQEKVNVMAQEKIRWLKNDEKRGIRNGETALVLSVDENKMEVLLMDGTNQTLELSCQASQHWDCAYAATAYIAQGDNKPETIAHGIGGGENSVEPPKITSVEEFLVSVTRGDNVTLVVDNIKTYQQTLYVKLESKRSTQEYLDPNRAAVKAKVQKMIQNVTGKAEKKTLKAEAVEYSPSLSLEKPKRYRSSHRSNQVQDWDKKSFIDKDIVNDYLQSDVLGYASQWLGSPHKKNGNEARWKGALTVNFKGSKAGMWKSWSSGQGGKDLISLYAYHYGLSWFDALQELAKDLGITREEPLFKTEKAIKAEVKRVTERQARAEKEAKLIKRNEAKRIKIARDCYNKSIPLVNTLGEKYLRDYRGIKGKLPNDFRFCARIKHRDTQQWTPALVLPARNSKGEIQGITRIYLDNKGNKLKTTYIDALSEEKKAADKLSLGVLSKTAVIVNQGKSSETIYIAEGVETALSVAQALPEQKVVASLSASRLQDIPLSPETKKVVICADEDGADAGSNKSVVDAINAYLAQGVKVEVAYPRALPHLDKTDFNDLLKIRGVSAIKEDFQKTIRIKEVKTLSVPDLLQLKKELESTKNTALQPHYQTQKELER